MTVPAPGELRQPVDFPRDKAEFDSQPFHRSLGITLEELRYGVARICIAANEATPRGIGGGIHGGVLAAMVDIAILRAVMTTLRSNDVPGGTASLAIDYLTPTRGPRIYAEATVVRKGRTLSYVEVSFTDESGTLCARGRSTYVTRQK